MASVYPEQGRTGWIVAQRPPVPRNFDPYRPHGFFLERERSASGEVVSSGVILLRNKECPWRCLMCDLWKAMPTERVPVGAIPQQIDVALEQWRRLGDMPRQVKLYNSGSFFDGEAIPLEDYASVAERVNFAENVVVESHPRLIGERAARLRDLLRGNLEVAMGLETAHAAVLEKLNKKFDLAAFAKAAEYLRRERIALRVFVLVKPPFLSEDEGVEWAVKSAAFAFECGATAVSLIPTRAGNGAMDRLKESGEFSPPKLGSLELALDRALALGRGRVFADTWGLEEFSTCPECLPRRVARLAAMNFDQRVESHVVCTRCDSVQQLDR